jgi:leucyl-tRNA synthetase
MGDEDAPFRYDAAMAGQLEQRWQDWWQANGTFHSPNPSGPLADGFAAVSGRPPFYVLDMFPYPSGAGLHVGHPLGYIGTDVYARYLRMTGHHVLHTFGYDSFGLPAEQYAIETGQHPAVTTQQNIAVMRRQLRRLGIGHDTRREVASSDPAYYRWTQWIFLQIFGSWYDEQADRARPVSELTAEFESGRRPLPDGRAWSSLTPGERDDVIDGHRLAYISAQVVNWCPGLGTVLANEEVTADGRSDIGNFPVYRRPMRQWMLRITAFAERLARDLDLVDWPEPIKQMQRNWIGISDGAWIDFPAGSGRTIRVYTTRPDTLPGATFLVLAPEHPLAGSLAPDPESARAVDAYRERVARLSAGQRPGQRTAGASGLFTGAYATHPLTGEPIPVYLAEYVLTGYGTGAIMAVPAADERDLEFADAFGLPVRSPDWAGIDGVDGAIDWLVARGLGERARSVRLRDWLFSRQRYWGEPFPIGYSPSGRPVALPESMLPVELPPVDDFRPPAVSEDTGEPVPPLARAASWADVVLDLGDGPRPYRRELNIMPQWAGSCWYYLRYLDPDDDRAFVAPDIERYWLGDGGVSLYVGGVEHAVLHLLYARFWHKLLYDLGHVSGPEPFRRLYNQGYILADAFTDARGMYVPAAEVVQDPDGGCTYRGEPVRRRAGKMGKSLKNGVSPDDIYARYGADTLRVYEMAMGPLDTDRPWNPDDIVGAHRFLQRLWRCLIDETSGAVLVSDAPLDSGTARRLHQTICVVRENFEVLRFNTAIARLGELIRHAVRLRDEAGVIPRALAEPLVLMVAPLAPHIAEELWRRLGHTGSLAYEAFPAADPALAAAETVTIPVQFGGKTRFTLAVPAPAGEAEIRQLLAVDPRYAEHTADRSVSRLIVVPGKIVNVLLG